MLAEPAMQQESLSISQLQLAGSFCTIGIGGIALGLCRQKGG